MKIPRTEIQTEYTKFQGGLDLETPVLSLYPGALLAGMNYEPSIEGGYSRLDGYEIYDGHPSPSSGSYHYLSVNLVDTVNVGDTIVGVDTGNTGVVVVVGTDFLDATKITESWVGGEWITFTADEDFTVGGNVKGAMTALPVAEGEPTGLGNATALAASADNWRADISAPIGSGAIRGLGLLNGILYCFIDNAAGTAGLIYKATASGWSNISLYHELSFNTGVGEISDGDTVTQLVSGASALVKRIVHESNTWAGGDATGRLILDSISGTFDNTHDLQVGGVTKATSISTADQITISPSGPSGGRYEIVQYNFFGSTDTLRMYGCDGVNRGFEFDGAVYVPINTGMTTDIPEHVIAHKKQLFFSFRGSSQNSGVGTSYKWTVVTGAAEIGIGDVITGYLVQAGKILAIFARDSTSQLEGTSVDDFVLNNISPDTGAIPWTMQNIVGIAYCLDDRGIINIRRSQIYGNFEQSTVSRKIRSVIESMRSVVMASTVYKSRNQYRLYGSDGTGICMTIKQTERGTSHEFSQFKYPVNIFCAISGEGVHGEDVVYFGATNGKVYQADKGSSFDGEEIEAYLRLSFSNSKSPTTLKTYRKATIEMTAESYSVIRFHPDFSYGDPAIAQHLASEITIQGLGAYWDDSYWETFFLDSFVISNPSFPITGSGVNLRLVVYSKSAIDLGHKIDGAIIEFTPRRLVR